MTRINSAINPFFLTDEHLLAEHREIKRICDNYYKRKLKNKFDDIPNKFTLGTGHVLFFIDKPTFTLARYKALHNECKERGFNTEDFSSNWNIYNNQFKDVIYIPTIEDENILKERIKNRIHDTPKQYWHYYGAAITKENACLKINQNILWKKELV